jgi:uncharacterized integral membrane protein
MEGVDMIHMARDMNKWQALAIGVLPLLLILVGR